MRRFVCFLMAAHLLSLAAAPGRAQEAANAARHIVMGRVTEAGTDRALADVLVVLGAGVDSAGSSRGMLTGRDGAFRFPDVPAGDHLLRVRSVGYEPVSRVVHVGAEETPLRVELAVEPVSVKGVTARAGPSTAMGGFYQRRARSVGGYFVDAADIERLNPRQASDVVREAPGIMLICQGTANRCKLRAATVPPSVVNFDPMTGRLRQDGDCPMEYFVDGVREPNTFEIDDLRPEEIGGVEVYVHGATVPIRFNAGVNTRCGVVVIWTRGIESAGGRIDAVYEQFGSGRGAR